ncbi:MAG: SDR family NAD(P)-dependent oxidoreductase [Pseudomonadota bacterium]
MKPLEGRIALITGASRGIGAAAARALAAAGAHCICTAKTKGALEELDDEIRALGGKASLVPLNLKHSKKVDALGPSLYQHFDRLDIFVSSAGLLGPLSPLHHIADADFENLMEINLLAQWRLMRTVTPLLARSPSARGIIMVCDAGQTPQAYWGPYAAADAGRSAMALTWAREHAASTTCINLFDPGPVATKLRAKAFPGEVASTITQPDDLAPAFVRMAHPDFTANAERFSFPLPQTTS